MRNAGPGSGRFEALLVQQGGAFTIAQAMECGLSRSSVARRAGKEWKRVLPGVYAAGEPTFEQRLRAACLWGGPEAVVSHRAAGRLLGLDGCADAQPELTVPLADHRQSHGLLLHRAEVTREDRRALRGIPLTTAARTLVDLAGSLELVDLAITVEAAWRRKIAALGWVERRLQELGSRGRRGTRTLRRVLDDCWARKRPLDSALEVKLWWLLRGSNLPRPVPGYAFDYADDEGEPGRIDFAYPSQRLAIEADGFEAHSQRTVFERDCLRCSRLAASGWRVLHVTWRQLDAPDPTLARIGRALAFAA